MRFVANGSIEDVGAQFVAVVRYAACAAAITMRLVVERRGRDAVCTAGGLPLLTIALVQARGNRHVEDCSALHLVGAASSDGW